MKSSRPKLVAILVVLLPILLTFSVHAQQDTDVQSFDAGKIDYNRVYDRNDSWKVAPEAIIMFEGGYKESWRETTTFWTESKILPFAITNISNLSDFKSTRKYGGKTLQLINGSLEWVERVDIPTYREMKSSNRMVLTPQEKEKISKLNKRIEEIGIVNLPLPPVVDSFYSKRTNNLMTMRFHRAPLDQFLDFYTDLSDMKTIVDEGVNTQITYFSTNRLKYDEGLRIIYKVLDNANIGLSVIDKGSVRVHWK